MPPPSSNPFDSRPPACRERRALAGACRSRGAMDMSTCRICLLSFDNADGRTRPVGDTAGSPQDSLCFKLDTIGFLQRSEISEVPCRLCWLCAARVEDAYDLKLQCLKASRSCGMENNGQSSLADIVASNPVVNSAKSLASQTILSLDASNLPEVIDLSCKKLPATSSVSIVSASARDMFTCVRSLSSTLQLNVSLLTNAIHFMENTLSLLTVLLSLREDSAAIKKSAQAIREEADLWKTKSALIEDASDFVREVSTTSFALARPRPKCPEKILKVVETPLAYAKSSPSPGSQLVSSKRCTSESPLRQHPSPKSRVSLDPTAITDPPVPEQQKQNEPDIPGQDVCEDLSPAEDGQSVRRSFRSRSIVDHLVYWPSFKKQGNGNTKTPSVKSKSSKKVLSHSTPSSESLDCLLLKRDVGSDSDNSSKIPEEEKWAIVRKRKNSSSPKNEKHVWKLRIKFGPSSSICNSASETSCQPKKSEPTENDLDENEDDVADDENDEDFKIPVKEESPTKTCPICGKTLCSNRNLQAHIRMHTGVSPYQCTYCNKIFSSGWNRAQHERVHTGEKPYGCDICQESFRYNVTLRNHKAKVHNMSL